MLQRMARPFHCLMVFIFLLAAVPVLTPAAGTTRYFDKLGNEISEDEYRKLTGTAPSASASPQSSPPAATPSPRPPAQNSLDGVAAASPKPASLPGELDLVSETIIRGFERDTPTKENALVLPVYQYLQIDYGSKEGGGLSFHFDGWGRVDLGDGDFYEDDPESSFLSGYIQYASEDYGFNFKVGRQQLYRGISNQSMDGVGFETVLTPYFTFSAYGGAAVGLDDDDGRDGDLIYGGRVAHRLGKRYEIGLSYQRIEDDSRTVVEQTRIDLFGALRPDLTFSGFSTYNLDTKGWAEHSYQLEYTAGSMYLRPFYEHYAYEDYFVDHNFSSTIFGFLRDTGEALSVFGGDVNWRQLRNLDLGATVKSYNYDLRQDTALYYGGNLAAYVNGLSRIGAEIGYMDGKNPETRYVLTRAYFYWDAFMAALPNGFLTGDVMYVRYDEEIFGRDYSFFVSLGTGMNFPDDRFKAKLSADYSNDPYYDSDLRGMLVIVFVY